MLGVQGTRPPETKLPKAEEAARPWAAFKLASAGGAGQPPAGTFKTQASFSETTPNAALVVEGKLGGRCTRMLIDTGSAVSLVREDVWREAAEVPVDHLTQPARPIVAANGETRCGRTVSLTLVV